MARGQTPRTVARRPPRPPGSGWLLLPVEPGRGALPGFDPVRLVLAVAVLVGATSSACAPAIDDDSRSGAGSASPTPLTGPRAPGGEPFAGADRPLVNEDWEILRMATAHGVMTIEIELGDIERSLEVARTLVEPLTADYAEVLVYVYAAGQGTGGHAPARRVQWTGRDGYVEIAYE